MATIKSYTDLSQSKKLAEILPIESADMRIGNYVGKSGKVDGTNIHYYTKGESFGAPEIINAWSLAALLELLEFPTLENDSIGKGKTGWMVTHYDDGMRYYTKYYNNPVDACVAMIEKLHEEKLF